MSDDLPTQGDPDDRPTLDHPSGAMDGTTVVGGGAPGDRPASIGPYRILETLGEGGMGVVYLAEQSEPVRRRVALKVIKLGMDTAKVVARFEAERQALAMMDHPGVAKVYDGGQTEQGRPYFVMEHVSGAPITEHCDQKRLPIKERLRLFIKVCEAVQHAHQKGIIHRDLKPSNVLVSERNDEAAPKVIDFGVAKALHQRLTDKTVYTEHGQFIGTPEYMSPEQAEMGAHDIDTRSDIYSLGVMLYELLTGQLPFDSRQLRTGPIEEMRRVLRDQAPAKPSTRLSDRTGVSATHAKNRGSEPRALASDLRGDLDWIVMKCLEADRSRRYESASSLAEDLVRHLNFEPVSAGPPGAAYRLRKFARRNRVGVAAGLVVAAALVAAVVVSSLFAVSEAEQRRLAVAAEGRAAAEAENARAINEFLTRDLLAAVAPSSGSGQGRDVLMRDVLDAASMEIDAAGERGGRFADKPLIEASIRSTLGRTYRLLGEFEHAKRHLEIAQRLRERELGERAPETLESLDSLGWLYYRQGLFAEAEPFVARTLGLCKETLGEEHPRTLEVMNLHGLVLTELGRLGEAETALRAVATLRERVFGEEHKQTLISRVNLALVLIKTGQAAGAESMLRETLAIQDRTVDPDDPDRYLTIHFLAYCLHVQGQNEAAERLYRVALEGRRRVLGPAHLQTLVVLNDLSALYQSMGRFVLLEPLLEGSPGIQIGALGPDHPISVDAVSRCAAMHLALGRPEEARPLILAMHERLREAAERPGATPASKHEYAWALLTCELEDLRDPGAALVMAAEASRMVGGKDAGILDTLALARFMTGDAAGAAAAQRAALGLLGEGSELRDGFEERLLRYQGGGE